MPKTVPLHLRMSVLLWADRSVSQLMTETTPQHISSHTFGHRNVSLVRYAQCGTFPAAGERRSSVQECVRYAHLETRRGDSVPGVSTRFYDPGAGGGAAIFAFFASGWGEWRGVAVPRSCWPALARVWPPRWSPSTGAAPTPSE